MAAPGVFETLKADASCPVCLDFYQDPVMAQCGHNFCRPCIVQSWEGAGTTLPLCPKCRQLCDPTNLRPNGHLQSIVDTVRQLCLQPERPSVRNNTCGDNMCEEHQEKLKVFCVDDQKPICLRCSISAAHRAHFAYPIEEAAQERKKILQSRLEELKKEQNELQQWLSEERRTSSKVEEKFKIEEERIIGAYEDMKQFLEQKKQTQLSILRRDKAEHIKKIQETIEELELQQTSVNHLFTETEEMCQKPDVQLMQEAPYILSRHDHVTVPKRKEGSADMERILQSFSEQHAYLEEKAKELKETIPTEQERRRLKPYKLLVTLDPDTVSRYLILSEDGRRVRRTGTVQTRPDNPKRFTTSPCVLGNRGLSSGRHYWELQLLQEAWWSAGVAKASVGREERLTECPEVGVWAVGRWHNQYKAFTSPPTPLSPRQHPMKVGLYLDYEGGQLSIYKAETMELLYTFTNVAFTDQVYPYFMIGGDVRLL